MWTATIAASPQTAVRPRARTAAARLRRLWRRMASVAPAECSALVVLEELLEAVDLLLNAVAIDGVDPAASAIVAGGEEGKGDRRHGHNHGQDRQEASRATLAAGAALLAPAHVRGA